MASISPNDPHFKPIFNTQFSTHNFFNFLAFHICFFRSDIELFKIETVWDSRYPIIIVRFQLEKFSFDVDRQLSMLIEHS